MSYCRTMMVGMIAAVAATLIEAPARAQDLLVRGGQIFDAVDGSVRTNDGVLVRGGRIVSLAPEGAAATGIATLDLAVDDCLLPGIVDLHAHYNINVCDLGRVDETEHYSIIYLANGVTSTFPAGEYDPEPMLAMRRRIDRGEQIGPRVYNSGPYFGQGMRRNASVEEVHAQVDEWAERGARGFKAKRIGPDQLAALIERAHLHGLTVTAHLDSGFRNSVNPRDAVLMGIDRIEHFLGGDLLPDSRPAYSSLRELTPTDLDGPSFDAIVELFIEHGTVFDATLTAYGYFSARDDGVYDQWDDEAAYLTPYVRAWAADKPLEPIDQFARIYRIKHETVRRFHEAGGTITLGTDHVSTGQYLAGFAAHREIHALNNAGIPAADVLRIATINGARAIGMGDRVGSIEAGKLGDMIVIRGNPLEDVRRTRTVHTVIKGGVVHRTDELLDAVRGKLGPTGPPE